MTEQQTKTEAEPRGNGFSRFTVGARKFKARILEGINARSVTLVLVAGVAWILPGSEPSSEYWSSVVGLITALGGLIVVALTLLFEHRRERLRLEIAVLSSQRGLQIELFLVLFVVVIAVLLSILGLTNSEVLTEWEIGQFAPKVSLAALVLAVGGVIHLAKTYFSITNIDTLSKEVVVLAKDTESATEVFDDTMKLIHSQIGQGRFEEIEKWLGAVGEIALELCRSSSTQLKKTSDEYLIGIPDRIHHVFLRCVDRKFEGKAALDALGKLTRLKSPDQEETRTKALSELIEACETIGQQSDPVTTHVNSIIESLKSLADTNFSPDEKSRFIKSAVQHLFGNKRIVSNSSLSRKMAEALVDLSLGSRINIQQIANEIDAELLEDLLLSAFTRHLVMIHESDAGYEKTFALLHSFSELNWGNGSLTRTLFNSLQRVFDEPFTRIVDDPRVLMSLSRLRGDIADNMLKKRGRNVRTLPLALFLTGISKQFKRTVWPIESNPMDVAGFGSFPLELVGSMNPNLLIKGMLGLGQVDDQLSNTLIPELEVMLSASLNQLLPDDDTEVEHDSIAGRLRNRIICGILLASIAAFESTRYSRLLFVAGRCASWISAIPVPDEHRIFELTRRSAREFSLDILQDADREQSSTLEDEESAIFEELDQSLIEHDGDTESSKTSGSTVQELHFEPGSFSALIKLLVLARDSSGDGGEISPRFEEFLRRSADVNVGHRRNISGERVESLKLAIEKRYISSSLAFDLSAEMAEGILDGGARQWTIRNYLDYRQVVQLCKLAYDIDSSNYEEKFAHIVGKLLSDVTRRGTVKSLYFVLHKTDREWPRLVVGSPELLTSKLIESRLLNLTMIEILQEKLESIVPRSDECEKALRLLEPKSLAQAFIESPIVDTSLGVRLLGILHNTDAEGDEQLRVAILDRLLDHVVDTKTQGFTTRIANLKRTFIEEGKRLQLDWTTFIVGDPEKLTDFFLNADWFPYSLMMRLRRELDGLAPPSEEQVNARKVLEPIPLARSLSMSSSSEPKLGARLLVELRSEATDEGNEVMIGLVRKLLRDATDRSKNADLLSVSLAVECQRNGCNLSDLLIGDPFEVAGACLKVGLMDSRLRRRLIGELEDIGGDESNALIGSLKAVKVQPLRRTRR